MNCLKCGVVICLVFLFLLTTSPNSDEIKSISGAWVLVSEVDEPKTNCVSSAEIESIIGSMDHIRTSQFNLSNSTSLLFLDPLADGGMQSFGKPINSLFDGNPSNGFISDFKCGNATYDGHRGIDIEVSDFYSMDEIVPIICVSTGVVIQSQDGIFDRNLNSPPGTANNILVSQFDGYNSLYWHMKKSSVQFSVGDTVYAGDTLGAVGSSGSSYWPHLHIEFWSGGVWEDPMQGTCNNSSIQFASQPQYVYDLPFELITHGVTSLPISKALVAERPPSISHMTFPGTISSWIHGRSLLAGDKFHWVFYQDGILNDSVTVTPTSPKRTGWWSISKTLNVFVNDMGSWKVNIYHNSDLIAIDSFIVDTDVNLAPSINDTTILVDVDGVYTGEFSATDFDGNEIYWYQISSNPANGTISQSGGRKRKFEYTPNLSFIGLDTLEVYAIDDDSLAGLPSNIIFDVTGNCCDLAGDFDGSGGVDITDLTTTVDWMFNNGSAPLCLNSVDVNVDCSTDIADLTYRVNHMFKGGPALICGCVK